MTNEMAQIRNEIEYNHQNMSTEKTQGATTQAEPACKCVQKCLT